MNETNKIMKKLLLLLVVPFIMVACEGPMGPMGPPGPGGIETGWETIPISVSANMWKYNPDNENYGDEPYFYYTYQVPELTNFIFNDGAVIAYIDFGGVRTPLPHVYHHRNEDDELWTETVDFRYAQGEVTFFSTFSDFSEHSEPQARNFKLVLIW